MIGGQLEAGRALDAFTSIRTINASGDALGSDGGLARRTEHERDVRVNDLSHTRTNEIGPIAVLLAPSSSHFYRSQYAIEYFVLILKRLIHFRHISRY